MNKFSISNSNWMFGVASLFHTIRVKPNPNLSHQNITHQNLHQAFLSFDPL